MSELQKSSKEIDEVMVEEDFETVDEEIQLAKIVEQIDKANVVDKHDKKVKKVQDKIQEQHKLIKKLTKKFEKKQGIWMGAGAAAFAIPTVVICSTVFNGFFFPDIDVGMITPFIMLSMPAVFTGVIGGLAGGIAETLFGSSETSVKVSENENILKSLRTELIETTLEGTLISPVPNLQNDWQEIIVTGDNGTVKSFVMRYHMNEKNGFEWLEAKKVNM